ncbi:MAG: M20 family metallopeptidase [Cloacibacillus sp.]
MNKQKESICNTVEALREELIGLSHDIHDNPELGLEEFKACAWQTALLKNHGFAVESPFCEMETAFKATFDTGKEGAAVAFLSEYDALEGIGHGCGHNIIAASAVGAAVALAAALKESGAGGKVTLFGTPAEETEGGKIPMVEAGAFNGYDCALMMHPASENIICRHGLAAQSVYVEFFGKAAHSSTPSAGINALASLISFFTSIDAIQQTWPNTSKINGIITDGGKASNVICEYARAAFTVRAARKKEILVMYADMERAAQAAALVTGAKAKVSCGRLYAERYPSRTLGEAFKANMAPLGEEMDYPDYNAQVGSSDIGNVSLVTPAIHEYLSIGDAAELISHHESFRTAAASKRADDVVLLAAKGLAMTGLDVMTDAALRAAMKDEFEKKVRPYQC